MFVASGQGQGRRAEYSVDEVSAGLDVLEDFGINCERYEEISGTSQNQFTLKKGTGEVMEETGNWFGGLALDSRVFGVWQKDLARSDSMDAASDLIGLSGFAREGIKLLRGCELSIVNSASFRMAVVSVVPGVKDLNIGTGSEGGRVGAEDPYPINETYPLDGSEASNMRRDLRFGKARGALELTEEGLPRLRLRWENPFAGEGLDEFQLVGQDELHVISTITVNGRTVSYTSVHTRKA
ncbi:hypothetical protein VOLCADRAFT_105421 [Volvox carteri f. nagariensis]|uniref:Uncharacterized protein n=1 Tax=Volvox carteri f. nagariensis TaxID=3068 RepID=D8U0P3_VOLCA|nr:uncharacterized protein VOLCADRAFT_105421 [Volvox carteri f. nagariensis]EFJ46754.1 hypothetical protein VOLCADRAFT_105421 [Volvox carteri f. nagariensis]|eukprot:XP_002952283.1 hypothetical protein VOLCADRAFT_105421 [Volvox carteri f. nagariensis]